MTVDFGGEAHELPQGAVIGLIGADASALLQAAGGRSLAYVLDLSDDIERARAELRLEELSRAGITILLASHQRDVLRRASDEIWWIDDGKVKAKGDAGEVLRAYGHHTREALRASESVVLSPSLRRGDGRAELIALQVPASIASGTETEIRVSVKFHADVADPVVGIMIRTRIGMEVYGTNTELENVKLGPCRAGDTRTVRFRFACNLCPQIYTLTAASHDPDGVWHDWMEDAAAFQVTDTRYTAGVANLKAQVSLD